jgi:hypothetical protein
MQSRPPDLKPMLITDYPQKSGPETVMQYANRLARCVVTDLIGSGLIDESDRNEAVSVAEGQIFNRLAIGDDPPPPGSL